ncbi:MAG TPA: D-aminoacyl-tRNA deacylase [Holophagaceae bacterium]|nr:D-aminoacyl-tRNA deacylase [Holophagaceae bacterium]
MRIVLQRVAEARVTAGDRSSAIGRGFLLLVGLEVGDTEASCTWMAAKIAGLRVFEDAEGKLNLGLADVGGEILAVSQFTLAGSVERGRRPSFDQAMPPEPARALFQRFVSLLEGEGATVRTGFFQEHMAVELVNDGPVTLVLERKG